MALNNRRRTPRYLSLGLADEQITVPQTAYASVLEKNRRSLIGRVLSPRRHDLYALIDKLTCDWGIHEPKCRGRIIGNRRFQFLFEEERDLEMVLWLGPYTFNGCLVVLQRWEDEQGPEFLRSVPMWLKIRGIPIQYLTDETIREIASSMGEVMEVELDDTMFDLSSVRARVNVSVDTRLCFKKVVRFGLRGEVKVVSFRYEEIGRSTVKFKFCRNCGDMNHLTSACSHVWVDVPDPNDRSLSPPPLELGFDGDAENNGEGGNSEQVEPVDVVQELPNGDGDQQQQQGVDGVEEVVQELPNGDGEEEQQQGVDGVEEARVTQVGSEMVGTSSEGSKRKFDAEEQADDVLEKRLRGSSDATEG